jgi:RHS repeat-associated protein
MRARGVLCVVLLCAAVGAALVVFAVGGPVDTRAAGVLSPTDVPPLRSQTAGVSLGRDVDKIGDVRPSAGVRADLARTRALLTQRRPPARHLKILKEGRTPTRRTYLNADGSRTRQVSLLPTSYQSGGTFRDIDSTLAYDPRQELWQTKANAWRAQFGAVGTRLGVRLTKGHDTLTMLPVDSGVVRAVVAGTGDQQTVTYPEAWPGVDLRYQASAEGIKEDIVVKRPDAIRDFTFRVAGTSMERVAGQRGAYKLGGALDEFSLAAPWVRTARRPYVGGRPYVSQSLDDKQLTVRLDPAWLRSLEPADYPLTIDPTLYTDYTDPDFYCYQYAVYSGSVATFRPDQRICDNSVGMLAENSTNNPCCNHQNEPYIWQLAAHADFGLLNDPNRYLVRARWYLEVERCGCLYDSGTRDPRRIYINHATGPLGFDHYDNSYGTAEGVIGPEGYVDATSQFRKAKLANDFGAWWLIRGEVPDPFNPGFYSYKAFDRTATRVEFEYTTLPNATTLVTPGYGASVVTTQPSLKAKTATDPDGDNVAYRFLVSTNATGGGQLVSSGWLDVPQWTVPSDVLADGQTYYWKVQTWDRLTLDEYGNEGSYADSETRPFRVDLRNGKDATQAFDDAGPVSVDQATGNVTTSNSSHAISALAGPMGVSLDYNSPVRSRPGLVGEYWNVPAGYPGGTPTGPPNLTRLDAGIDFSWDLGSPQLGSITPDWFYGRWTGYFVVPKDGDYFFGGNHDDLLVVNVAGTQVYSNGGCYSGVCYGSSVRLKSGDLVPLKVEHMEATGPAYAHLYVKGPVDEQVVPATWLRAGAAPVAGTHGLTGSYYSLPESVVSPPNPTADRLFVRRVDPQVSFNWGDGRAVPGGPSDNFFVSWTGYFTPTTSGAYTFGTVGDDGTRLTVNGVRVVDNWVDQPPTPKWATQALSLTANKPVPIVLEYYEHGGGASVELRADGPGISRDLALPSQFLSPRVQVLPDGWNLGLDADGDLSYDFAAIGSSSVVLRDSTGETHEYKAIPGSAGYTPPVNEDGVLTRNADGSLTLQDSDGSTYVFADDGTLRSMTAPVDDRKPAALQYLYSGTPARLTQVRDGVDTDRTVRLLYRGDSACPPVPAGYVDPGTNMICAVTSSDGPAGGDANTTKLFYTSDAGGLRLARISQPGKEPTDYGYDPVTGLLTSVRDSLANEAIVAGKRANDDSTTTQIGYDVLARARAVAMPAANAGDSRLTHRYDYLIDTNQTDHVLGTTATHLQGAPEPKGFSRQIAYDETFRTLADTDVTGLTTTTVWDTNPADGTPRKDLVLASTDPAGLMSTTLYDYADRPVDQWGPAPKSWFGTPITSYVADPYEPGQEKGGPNYRSMVPHQRTAYDENLRGLAATYFNYNGTSKTLSGVPKGHSTGIGNASGDVDRNWGGSKPANFDSGATGITGWGARLAGDLRLTTAGTYTFRIRSDDGVRLYVDNHLVIDDWTDGDTRSHGQLNVQSAVITKPADRSVVPIRLDYYNKSFGETDANLTLYMTAPGGQETSSLGDRLLPHYGLTTSTTTYDSSSAVGDSVTTTDYGTQPEFGLARSTTVDPGGLNLKTESTYEPVGSAGSFQRQTSKTLPGGTKTDYVYYGATETVDNPCTSAADPQKQAGMLKQKIERGLAGAGQDRVTETIYDAAGRIVASRLNDDPWTCTSYDARGRVLTTVIPTIGTKPGRTITNNWAVGANPLTVSTADDAGTITTTSDLLGRTASYTDTAGNTTTTSYDTLGRLAGRSGPLGTELFRYDSYNRLAEQRLDGVILATLGYDQYSRLERVRYPTSGPQEVTMTRDSLGRAAGQNYILRDGSTISDRITRSQSGQIIAGTENGVAKSYSYDKAARLSKATLGINSFSYGFGTTTNCPAGSNPDAGKNANRTSTTRVVGGVSTTTTYCYDQADRLTKSSNPLEAIPLYDVHGNTTRVGAGAGSDGSTAAATSLVYDASDRSSAITEGTTDVRYTRDGQNRIIRRQLIQPSGTTTNVYGFTGSGDTPDFIADTANVIQEKYLELPGGVLLTIRPSKPTPASQVFSLPDLHGDIMATTDATGTKTGEFRYDPFGNKLGDNTPDNSRDGATYGWVGRHEKLTESKFALTPTQMGARVYLPSLGRYTSVDPIPGGVENSYVYPPDPANDFDLDGNFGWKNVGNWIWKYKADIALNALTFVPGIGQAALAARLGTMALRAGLTLRATSTAARATRYLRPLLTRTRVAGNTGGILRKYTYTGINGGSRFIKLDRPDKVRPYLHWSYGRVAGNGAERGVSHRRWWGRKVR